MLFARKKYRFMLYLTADVIIKAFSSPSEVQHIALLYGLKPKKC